MLGAGVIGIVLSIGTYIAVKTRPTLKRSIETQVRVAGFVVTVFVLLPFLEEVCGLGPVLKGCLQEVPGNIETAVSRCASPF
jgi:hypothetical protein